MTLGISTTGAEYEIVIGKDQEVLFSSKKGDYETNDLTQLIQIGMNALGKTLQDVQSIYVNMGPGATTRVRTGIAYANSLGFGLNVPVIPVSSLELLGLETSEKHQLPALCSMRSVKDTAYFGLFQNGKVQMKYGKFEEVALELAEGLEQFVFAGYIYKKTDIKELFGDRLIQVIDNQPVNGELLITKGTKYNDRAVTFPDIAHPITEQNIHNY